MVTFKRSNIQNKHKIIPISIGKKSLRVLLSKEIKKIRSKILNEIFDLILQKKVNKYQIDILKYSDQLPIIINYLKQRHHQLISAQIITILPSTNINSPHINANIKKVYIPLMLGYPSSNVGIWAPISKVKHMKVGNVVVRSMSKKQCIFNNSKSDAMILIAEYQRV